MGTFPNSGLGSDRRNAKRWEARDSAGDRERKERPEHVGGVADGASKYGHRFGIGTQQVPRSNYGTGPGELDGRYPLAGVLALDHGKRHGVRPQSERSRDLCGCGRPKSSDALGSGLAQRSPDIGAEVKVRAESLPLQLSLGQIGRDRASKRDVSTARATRCRRWG